ncbi:threonine aldolase family protein [Frisingicoccus sp.]|uniref:threonine aldolase family protein n=1 Tax=Frisingicoccus sp. TaxID=1918627 RepID=UPI0015BAA70D|nr:beta-eliminating lyase-related protein [Frisingicoccus sp.]MEE0752647.1 beta-eliminating lyase-related protein [Frisingicoccus sp.]
MQHFDSDYMEGAHPEILRRLAETNMEKTPGYGTDSYCESARKKILEACGCPEGEVYFLSGGTQTNMTVIASMLKPYQGVVAADTGHISVHEAGAIEASGHKVLTVPGVQGKLMPENLADFMEKYYGDENHEHMVWPGMVYISHPTEYGTLYTAAELKALRELCDTYHMPLFLDGARLGYGLMAEETDVTLKVIAEYCDAFYIGGTKVGALFGEAVVLPKKDRIPHFFTMIKQRGALMAKGRILGIQFDTLFTDDLYFKISRHAIDMAMKMKQGFLEKGYALYLDSMTNQQFVVLEPEKLKALSEKVTFGFWENLEDGRTVVRFATSWATLETDVDALLALI